MLTNVQIQILKKISPAGATSCDGSAYEGKSKLAVLMGNEFFSDIAGKVVIDFGCGEGADAVEMATKGAKRVIGIDIREDILRAATQKALNANVHKICSFTTSTEELADVVVSVDAFEHFVSAL